MNRQEAERLIEQYAKPILGFALKRCACIQDAEDLAQEIALKVFRALLQHEEIKDAGKFIWTAAHHALANYYRRAKGRHIGAAPEEIERIPDKQDIVSELVLRESEQRLRQEIAYLSEQQRRIVIAYYFENKKQGAIAEELGIPCGTVKWHLFEAKKELKRGMEKMRETSELKFNPIRFSMCGISGSSGTKGGPDAFFRSALSQNIEYSVRERAKTANEIADDLGVSPVYVENEADYLAEYGFLVKNGEKYLCNILLDEPTSELIRLRDEMYERAAALAAPALYDELSRSPLLDDEAMLVCSRMIDVQNGKPVLERDKNFMLWALIPYVAACSGEALRENEISFEEAATLRPDGGQNICYASVMAPDAVQPRYAESMSQWFGPSWTAYQDLTLWQVDSEWSLRNRENRFSDRMDRALVLLRRHLQDEALSAEEYAFLAEDGYMRCCGEPEKEFYAALQVVWIRSEEAKRRLLEIGDRVKAACNQKLSAVKAPYVEAVMASTPKHLQKMQAFGLQYIFYSDGWFLLHCLKELVKTGKLALPKEEQRKSLSVILCQNR